MALTEKQKEQIREEEALRQEVRHQSHGKKCSSGGRRRKAFWMGVAAGIIGSLLFGQLFCKRGGFYGKKCSFKHHGAYEAPAAGSKSEK